MTNCTVHTFFSCPTFRYARLPDRLIVNKSPLAFESVLFMSLLSILHLPDLTIRGFIQRSFANMARSESQALKQLENNININPTDRHQPMDGLKELFMGTSLALPPSYAYLGVGTDVFWALIFTVSCAFQEFV